MATSCAADTYIRRSRNATTGVQDRTEIEFEVGNPCSKTQHDAARDELIAVGWHVSYVLHLQTADGVRKDVSIMRRR